MHSAHLLLAVLVSALLVQGGKLPTWLTTCYRDDPNFNACAEKKAQAVIPFVVHGERKYHITPMDPLKVTEFHIAKGATKIGLDITMRNVSLTGIALLQLSNFSVDFNTRTIKFAAFFPHIEIIGLYEVSGQILVLPITGKGPANITLVETGAHFIYNYEIEKRKNGKEHMVIKNAKLDFKPKRAYVRLDNLFNGDKLLGENMNIFLNENWVELVDEIGPVAAHVIEEGVKQVFEGLAKYYPFDDLFPLRP